MVNEALEDLRGSNPHSGTMAIVPDTLKTSQMANTTINTKETLLEIFPGSEIKEMAKGHKTNVPFIGRKEIIHMASLPEALDVSMRRSGEGITVRIFEKVPKI